MTVRLLDSCADWCDPYKTQDSIPDELESDYRTVEFVKVDIDGGQDAANQYQVHSLPTLIVENDGDGVVGHLVGVTQHDDIESALS